MVRHDDESRTTSLRLRLIVLVTSVAMTLLVALGVSTFTVYRMSSLGSTLLTEQTTVQEIFANLNKCQELLDRYTRDPSPEVWQVYHATYPVLQTLSGQLLRTTRSAEDDRTITDFDLMLQTFTEEANGALNAIRDGNTALASVHKSEALKVFNLLQRQVEPLFAVVVRDARSLQVKAENLMTLNAALEVIFSLLAIGSLVLFLAQARRHVLGPVGDLTRAARRFSEVGSAGLTFAVRTTDREIAGLAGAFDTMVATINDQIRDLKASAATDARLREEELRNQRMQRLIKEAQMASLQARINPHFLFNTLNMVCQMAYLEKAERSATLLEAFSALLRYNLDQFDKVVSLDTELKNLQDYISIQRLRFGERIEFLVDVDPALANLQIPCLTLQPFVENAVVHGVKSYIRHARIAVRARSLQGRAFLEVEDNGVGMDEAEVSNLLEELGSQEDPAALPSRRVGIRNVHDRLSLIYGNDLGFEIRSRRGGGTTVEMSFPGGVHG